MDAQDTYEPNTNEVRGDLTVRLTPETFDRLNLEYQEVYRKVLDLAANPIETQCAKVIEQLSDIVDELHELLLDGRWRPRQNHLCPHCHSEHIEGGFVEIDEMHAYQPVFCDECGSSWTDVYEFDHIIDLSVPREQPQPEKTRYWSPTPDHDFEGPSL